MDRTSVRNSVGRPSEELLLRYAAIIEGSDDAIIGKTPGGIITSWNHGAEKMFGYKAEDVIGESILIIFPADRIEEEIMILEKVARGERVQHFETVRKRKDGSLLDVSVSISPLVDITGRIIGVSKIVRDNTAEARAAEALKLAEHRYKSTLDSMMEGCQLVGFDWRYIYVNEVAARQLDRKREELIGRKITDVFPGIERTGMFLALEQCVEQRVPAMLENSLMFEDWSTGWFKLRMEPAEEGVLILSIDVTQDKRNAEELERHRAHLEELVLERTASLEEANSELEAFSYSVSHDLRAPLRHIDSFAALLSGKIGSSLDDESAKYLSLIRSAAGEMAEMINALLEFSRNTRQAIVKSKVAIGELCNRVIIDLEEEIRGRKIDWKIGELPEVDADPRLMYLVVFNLISNAVKFSSAKERAEISIEHMPDGNENLFVIRDNGVGFDMKYSDKLFGVFQRLHRREDFRGTGIGLANVKRIISRHGGRTWAEAREGQGASFFFTLPSGS